MATTGNNDDVTPPFDPVALRVTMERALRGIGATDGSNEQRAQELVYDAMEATTPEDCLQLVKQALDLDPENVDGLLMLADASGFAGEERIKVLRDIVAVGAKRLGDKAFAEFAPHFWGVIETRPYMRARRQLAEALHEAGQLDAAAVEYTEMLALNENDNQAVRYALLPILLEGGQLAEASALLERFKEECEWSVVLAWCGVLKEFLSGNESGAAKALAIARKQNGHMEAYLKGHRRLPKNIPASYSPGSREEAVCFAEVLLRVLKSHPEAAAWISSQ